MKLKAFFLGILTLSAIAHTSCDDSQSNIGSSIVEDKITITVDSSFTVVGQPYATGAVQSRTLLQLLGKIDAEGFGTLSSDVVTQFMPSASLDTTNVTVNDIDSLKLMFAVYHGNFVGDSITPMGIDVYRLTRDLPSPIFSDFDPTGYFDPSQKIGSLIYNTSTMGESDSLRNAYYHTISVNLPRELAQDIFTAYKQTPEIFANPTEFINKVFKGLYIRNSFGSGRLTLVSNTLMRAYYHRTLKKDDGSDSIVPAMANYFAVTPEIITNNNIDLSLSPEINSLIAQGENIIVSPTGYDVKFTFPIQNIISSYKTATAGKESAINSLSLSIPVDSVSNKFNFGPAPSLLLVLKNKKDEFFQNNSLPDNITSFYADYDATAQRYYFGAMRNYLMTLIDKETIEPADCEFVLTPVYVATESSGDYYYGTTSTVTAVTPFISVPTLTKIKFDEAKIKFTFSDQSINY